MLALKDRVLIGLGDHRTLCSAMRSWKPLYAMLASNDSSERGLSSKAITRCPRAAAASEK